MIHCIIGKKINKIKNNYSHQNLRIVVYYLLKGLNNKGKKNINEINNIFKINNYYDDDFKKQYQIRQSKKMKK